MRSPAAIRKNPIMPKLLWSHLLPAPAAGVALARESGAVLAWDVQNRLTVIHRSGAVVAEAVQVNSLLAAAIADDGSAIAVADDHSLARMSPELSLRWRQPLGSRPTALALETLGQFAAVADSNNSVHFFDASGRPFGSSITAPRALYHVRVPPESQTLFAAADFGLVVAVDLTARSILWQDNPVIHLGDLDVAAGGEVVALACFSEGIRRFDRTHHVMPSIATPQPCRYVAMSYSGSRFLAGSIVGSIAGLDDRGALRFEQSFEQMIVGVQLSPLADVAVIAMSDGRVLGLDVAAELK